MCGIVGFFDINHKDYSAKTNSSCDNVLPHIERALSTMEARGPDDEGVYSGNNFVFGHRRLSIIDIEGGHQPFIDRESDTVIVFNGEIYNYRTLRKRLESRGHAFRTSSDTEVLLKAYLEWGAGCLDELSGMFAFAIADNRKKRLFAARDRLGIKPLFFTADDKRILFASSIPALLCFPQVSRKMDLDTVSHYLSTIRSTMGERTLFRDIKTLLPGQCMLAGSGIKGVEIKKYWNIPVLKPADKPRPDTGEAAARVREMLEESVSEQLISDVPLGGFLSGGIDSSIIASIAGKVTSGNYNAYSIGYDRDGYNEWDFVRSAADTYEMNCREIHLNDRDYPDTWTELIRHKGMPLSTPNEVAIYHLASSLKNDFTVALSGEGADEIFGGYVVPYFSAFDYERARRTAPGKNEILSTVDRAMQRLYRRPYLLCRPDHYFLVNSWIPMKLKNQLLSRDTWKALDRDNALFTHYEELFNELEGCSTFDSYMHIHARINLEGLLSRVDSSTMAASVEARVPFTDHRIAEYLFTLPDSYKINWKNGDARFAEENLNIAEIDSKNLLESKLLLRRAFRNDVPQSIMNRRKMSFPVPFKEWFSEWMHEVSRDAILKSDAIRGLFNTSLIDSILADPGRPDASMALWPITNLCMWQQEYEVEV